MTTIGVLHPGAMGAAVGAVLAARGEDVIWASSGRSPQTAQRAREAGLRDVVDVEALLAHSELVLSICPPDAAIDVARSARGLSGTFLDANAVSPDASRRIGEIIGGGYVDGGIIGPPPVREGTTRLYLSGDGSDRVAEHFSGTPLHAHVIAGAGPTAASALKMVYAAWTKGSAALLLAIEQTASARGVAGVLHDEWRISQSELGDRLAAARRDAQTKGWRWEGEMRQIAATFLAAEQPAGFHEAAAEVFGGEASPMAFRAAALDAGDGARLVQAMRDEIAVIYDGLDLDGDAMPRAGAAELSPPGGAFIVGYRGSEAVCCGGIKRLDDRACEIKRMYVVPRSRGRGVARRLLAELEETARALGYVTVRLDTGPRQAGARRLYQSAGYVEVEDFNANPVAAFWGEKPLR
jgi:GNAT superfamily N-acetyltransferase